MKIMDMELSLKETGMGGKKGGAGCVGASRENIKGVRPL